jgi:hypothetical protein
MARNNPPKKVLLIPGLLPKFNLQASIMQERCPSWKKAAGSPKRTFLTGYNSIRGFRVKGKGASGEIRADERAENPGGGGPRQGGYERISSRPVFFFDSPVDFQTPPWRSQKRKDVVGAVTPLA